MLSIALLPGPVLRKSLVARLSLLDYATVAFSGPARAIGWYVEINLIIYWVFDPVLGR